MGTISTKYNVGDTVYAAGNNYVEVWTLCPDCEGSLKWLITFAGGRQEECPCQTCGRFWGAPAGKVSHSEYQPSVLRLTVGQVQFDGDGPRYMCEETGIGSGTLHSETGLFETMEEAQIAAQDKYVKQMAHIASLNFAKKGKFADYLGTFGFSRADALEKQRQMRTWLTLISQLPMQA